MQRKYCFFLWIALAAVGCNRDKHDQTVATNFVTLEGQTMGTYYGLKYADSLGRNFQGAIDSLLEEVNLGVSTYIESSLISQFNCCRKPPLLWEIPRVGLRATFSRTTMPPKRFFANRRALLILRSCLWSTTGVLATRPSARLWLWILWW